MGPTLEQIVARLEDPETPIVWLDPSLPERLWELLPAAVLDRGYRVLNLDEDAAISDRASLQNALARIAPPSPAPESGTLALRDTLLSLPHENSKGWVVLFHRPEALRQNDEVAFEDFLEILELVHESRYESSQQVFKLVVRD